MKCDTGVQRMGNTVVLADELAQGKSRAHSHLLLM
jgi:hypothetical protein